MKLKEDIVINQALAILEQRLRHKGDILQNPRDVRNYLVMSIAEKEREVFGILLLNRRLRLIEFNILFEGTLDSSPVHPREVIKLCIAHNAASVILAHNHPSGDPEPSESDIRITEKLRDALGLIDVNVVDHFIIGGTQTISLAERGYL